MFLFSGISNKNIANTKRNVENYIVVTKYSGYPVIKNFRENIT